MLLRAVPALCASLGLLAGCGEAPAARPNLLLIVADDLAARALGYEGNALARTPNLDRLAREGTHFRRAYVPTPQCAPSRAALLLGVYPHQSGALANRSAWDTSRTTLADVLRAAGYRTGFVGKWHLGEDEKPQAGFDSWCAIDRRALSYFDPRLSIDGRDEARTGYVPTLFTDEALRFLRADDDRPFFLWLAYTSPHEPLAPPPDPAMTRDPAQFSLPPSSADDLSEKPSLQRASEGHRLFQQHGTAGVLRVSALYQSVVDALDVEIGRVLAELDARGLAEDTLVVFLSDNGTLHGEHQLVTKGPAFYEELVRTPLVVRGPGVLARELDTVVSSLDLFPTLAHFGGAALPADLAGHDLGALLAGGGAPEREAVFLEYERKQPDDPPTPMLGWIDAREKYVRYLGSGEEELYDLATDPEERVNLAFGARAPERLNAARARLEPFRAQAEPALR
jgi:N-acetylglucosamine-6-sulfatase